MLRSTAVLLLLCVSSHAAEKIPQITETITGRVVGVADGDTVTVLVGREQVKVRLEGIDAPEKVQEHGTKAKEALSELIYGRTVDVGVTGKDRYGRTLGIIYEDGADINAKMVEDGWAWHYKEYNTDPRLAKLEEAAREKRVGLWSHDRPMPPWEFRRLGKERAELQAKPKDEPKNLKYWLNTSSNVRHNSTCKHYKNTKKGRECSGSDGKPCGICKG